VRRADKKSDKTYRDLSRMWVILYSKFWAATALSRTGLKKWRLTERIQELLPVFSFGYDDFTASTAHIGVDVEHLP